MTWPLQIGKKFIPRRVKQGVKDHLKRRFFDEHQLPEFDLVTAGFSGPQLLPEHRDDICLPPHYGPSSHDDFTVLMRIARMLSCRVIVELGTAHGNTVANLCATCPDAHIYTVNAEAPEQTGRTVTFSLTASEIGRCYRAHGYSQRVSQVLANTLDLDLAPHLGGQKVDLAIVDACHDTEYVINDFEKVRPFVRKGGVVLLHDTHPSMDDHLAGSYVACMYLRKCGYDVRHIPATWWGIWVNQDKVQPEPCRTQLAWFHRASGL